MSLVDRNVKVVISQNKEHQMIGIVKKYIKDQNILNQENCTFDELLSNAKLWKIEQDRGWDLSIGIKFIKSYGRYNLVLLETLYSQKCEGAIMNHCLIDKKKVEGHLYSLRNHENRPVVTFKLNPENISDNQIKARSNGKIPLIYVDYVLQILADINIPIVASMITDMNLDRIHINDNVALTSNIIKVINQKHYILAKCLSEKNVFELIRDNIIRIESNLFLLDFLLKDNLLQDNLEGFLSKMKKLPNVSILSDYSLTLAGQYSATKIIAKLINDGINSDSFCYNLDTINDLCEDLIDSQEFDCSENDLNSNKDHIRDIMKHAFVLGSVSLTEIDLLNYKYKIVDNVSEIIYSEEAKLAISLKKENL